MSPHESATCSTRSPLPLGPKLWREVKRPFRRRSQTRHDAALAAAPQAPAFGTFHPARATVEPEARPLLERLVRESRRHPGPIIEIGTLMGITTTTIALNKAPDQKVITVDKYCWNPWGISSEAHQALAAQVLRYLVETGHVEQVVMCKNEFFETYSGPAPALVFLDAIHDYEETKKDIEWASRVGAAVISGHDYSADFPGVIKVVDEFGGPRELLGSVWAL
jgi:predicted O-methyltransferase YrrM